jgi:hypothetical protein
MGHATQKGCSMSNADIVVLCAAGALFIVALGIAVLWDSSVREMKEKGFYRRGQGRD